MRSETGVVFAKVASTGEEEQENVIIAQQKTCPAVMELEKKRKVDRKNPNEQNHVLKGVGRGSSRDVGCSI